MLRKFLVKVIDNLILTLIFLNLYLKFVFSDMHYVINIKFKWEIIMIHKLVSE